MNSTYAWSKSQDLNSLGSQGTYTLQNNFNPKGDYGLSDFDARNHFVFSGTWNLPFHGNRLVEGWLLANITQLQSGNPMNVVTTSTYNGVTPTARSGRRWWANTPRDAAQPWPNGNVSFIQGTACATPTPGLHVLRAAYRLWQLCTQRAHRTGLCGFGRVAGKDNEDRRKRRRWLCASMPSIC